MKRVDGSCKDFVGGGGNGGGGEKTVVRMRWRSYAVVKHAVLWQNRKWLRELQTQGQSVNLSSIQTVLTKQRRDS